jgi:hypothetical protein
MPAKNQTNSGSTAEGNYRTYHPQLPLSDYAGPIGTAQRWHALSVRQRLQMKQRNLLIWVNCLLFVIVAALYLAAKAGWITREMCFVSLSIILLGYLAFEINLLRRDYVNPYWPINPVVLASFVTFVLQFGITNLLYFFPEDILTKIGSNHEVTEAMNYLMLLVLLGAFAMWRGYRSRISVAVSKVVSKNSGLNNIFKRSYHLRPFFLAACVGLSLLSRLGGIWLGVYGYSSEYSLLYDLAKYTQYLALGESLGKVALISIALQYYSQEVRKLPVLTLYTLLAYEVFFGLLSGFKSQIAMPFIIVGLCKFYQQRKFHVWVVGAVFISVIAGYLVVEPFRIVRYQDPGFEGRTVSGIYRSMLDRDTFYEPTRDDLLSIFPKFISRINLTYIGSLGIEYADAGPLPDGSPDFLRNIFLAPAHAVVPRIIWESKPYQDIGQWYTRVVLGHNTLSSTGMSPFTYLYFAGGIVSVFLGFFFVGIAQRTWWDAFFHRGSGPALLFFGMLGALVVIDSAFDSFFVSLFRMTPLLLIVQYGLFRK